MVISHAAQEDYENIARGFCSECARPATHTAVLPGFVDSLCNSCLEEHTRTQGEWDEEFEDLTGYGPFPGGTYSW